MHAGLNGARAWTWGPSSTKDEHDERRPERREGRPGDRGPPGQAAREVDQVRERAAHA